MSTEVSNKALLARLCKKGILMEQFPGAERINLFYNKLESGFMVDIAQNAVLSDCFGWTAPGNPGGSEGNRKCFPN
jgi:hypothetical protein